MQKYSLISLEGEFDYQACLMLQNLAIANIAELDTNDYLILIRHKPVITMGQFAKKENILASKEFLENKGIKVFDVDRGGDVTYHGPGQLIGYPLINLRRKKITDYKSKLCKTLTDLLQDYGIKSEEGHKEKTGIWVGDEKIAAIGYAFKKFPEKDGKIITKHGFALYVLDDMENFQYINPCGRPNVKLTSMEKILGKKIDFEELKNKYTQHFEKVFNYESV